MLDVSLNNEKEIIKDLKDSGYSDQEVNKIIQGYKEKKSGEYFSSEEVYEYLLKKEVTYV